MEQCFMLYPPPRSFMGLPEIEKRATHYCKGTGECVSLPNRLFNMCPYKKLMELGNVENLVIYYQALLHTVRFVGNFLKEVTNSIIVFKIVHL